MRDFVIRRVCEYDQVVRAESREAAERMARCDTEVLFAVHDLLSRPEGVASKALEDVLHLMRQQGVTRRWQELRVLRAGALQAMLPADPVATLPLR